LGKSMRAVLKRVDRGWTALSLIAAIFIAGGVATVDYVQLRDTVESLDIREAGREFFRLQAKIDEGTADQIDIIDWCQAAARIGAGCEMEGKKPSAGLIPRAWAARFSDIGEREWRWFRRAHYSYQIWLRRTGGRGWFYLSRDYRKDRTLKRRYCSIGQRAWSARISRFPIRMRRRYACPLAQYISR